MKNVNTIRKDNTLTVKYLKELGDMEEIEKNIWNHLKKLLKIWVRSIHL
jgi:hypothetical protein